MITTIEHASSPIRVDLSKPIDISIPLRAGPGQLSAWYVGPVEIKPVEGDGFIGDVKKGGAVNFRDIYFNPHGHGTHTECVGHISEEDYSINQHLRTFFFKAQLISISPESHGQDHVIELSQIREALNGTEPEAIIIRTLPNGPDKCTRNYSNSNPPYLEAAAAQWMVQIGIDHLLIDLPSVDREEDGGQLAAHKAFWQYPSNTRAHATITEFIYVDPKVEDGAYLLNLQIASFENDATPSKPVLYKIIE